MRRRQALAVLGGAFSSAGCLDDLSGQGGTPSNRTRATATPNGSRFERSPSETTAFQPPEAESTTAGGAETSTARTQTPLSELAFGDQYDTADKRSLRLSSPVMRKLVVSPEQVSHHTYHRVSAAPDGSQYLSFGVLTVGLDVEDYTELPLAIELDGVRYERNLVLTWDGRSRPYDRVGFRLPVTEVSSGAVVWERDGGPSPRWRLPDEVLSDLGAAPDFEVRSLEIPEQVQADESIPVTFTVANTGDRDGRFLVELDAQEGSLPLDEVSLTVPAGESVTHTHSVSFISESDVDVVRVVFDWDRERVSRRVSVVNNETP